jgi:hypothetical protein
MERVVGPDPGPTERRPGGPVPGESNCLESQAILANFFISATHTFFVKNLRVK